MEKEYDHTMKVLVDADPLAIARFVLSQSERLRTLAEKGSGLKLLAHLSTEFPGSKAEADGLLHLETGLGEPFLALVESQSTRDGTMGDRLIDYCRRTRRKHGPLPIVACVIYLRPDGIIEEAPHTWPALGGGVCMIFDYVCIKIWEVPRAEILALGQPSLLPLALLIKGPVDHILVKETFEELIAHKLYDLLPVGHTIAGWLLKEADLEWLRKEYQKMLELFKDSPAYAWMTENAREEEREAACERFRQVIVALVEGRFPQLVPLVQKQVTLVQDQDRLQQAILQVSRSQDASELEILLLGLSEQKEEA